MEVVEQLSDDDDVVVGVETINEIIFILYPLSSKGLLSNISGHVNLMQTYLEMANEAQLFAFNQLKVIYTQTDTMPSVKHFKKLSSYEKRQLDTQERLKMFRPTSTARSIRIKTTDSLSCHQEEIITPMFYTLCNSNVGYVENFFGSKKSPLAHSRTLKELTNCVDFSGVPQPHSYLLKISIRDEKLSIVESKKIAYEAVLVNMIRIAATDKIGTSSKSVENTMMTMSQKQQRHRTPPPSSSTSSSFRDDAGDGISDDEALCSKNVRDGPLTPTPVSLLFTPYGMDKNNQLTIDQILSLLNPFLSVPKINFRNTKEVTHIYVSDTIPSEEAFNAFITKSKLRSITTDVGINAMTLIPDGRIECEMVNGVKEMMSVKKRDVLATITLMVKTTKEQCQKLMIFDFDKSRLYSMECSQLLKVESSNKYALVYNYEDEHLILVNKIDETKNVELSEGGSDSSDIECVAVVNNNSTTKAVTLRKNNKRKLPGSFEFYRAMSRTAFNGVSQGVEKKVETKRDFKRTSISRNLEMEWLNQKASTSDSTQLSPLLPPSSSSSLSSSSHQQCSSSQLSPSTTNVESSHNYNMKDNNFGKAATDHECHQKLNSTRQLMIEYPVAFPYEKEREKGGESEKEEEEGEEDVVIVIEDDDTHVVDSSLNRSNVENGDVVLLPDAIDPESVHPVNKEPTLATQISEQNKKEEEEEKKKKKKKEEGRHGDVSTNSEEQRNETFSFSVDSSQNPALSQEPQQGDSSIQDRGGSFDNSDFDYDRTDCVRVGNGNFSVEGGGADEGERGVMKSQDKSILVPAVEQEIEQLVDDLQQEPPAKKFKRDNDNEVSSTTTSSITTSTTTSTKTSVTEEKASTLPMTLFQMEEISLNIEQLKNLKVRGQLVRRVNLNYVKKLMKVKLIDLFSTSNPQPVLISTNISMNERAIIVESNHRMTVLSQCERLEKQEADFKVQCGVFVVDCDEFEKIWTRSYQLDFKFLTAQQNYQWSPITDILSTPMRTSILLLVCKESRRCRSVISRFDEIIFYVAMLKTIISEEEKERLRNCSSKARAKKMKELVKSEIIHPPSEQGRSSNEILWSFLMKENTQRVFIEGLQYDKWPVSGKFTRTIFFSSLVDDVATEKSMRVYLDKNTTTCSFRAQLALIVKAGRAKSKGDNSRIPKNLRDTEKVRNLNNVEEFGCVYCDKKIPEFDKEIVARKKLTVMCVNPSKDSIISILSLEGEFAYGILHKKLTDQSLGRGSVYIIGGNIAPKKSKTRFENLRSAFRFHRDVKSSKGNKQNQIRVFEIASDDEEEEEDVTV